jgi:hypothetical protein
MQTTKLGISQKVFAQLERLFHKTVTREFTFSEVPQTHPLAPPVTTLHTMQTSLPASTGHDALEPLQNPRFHSSLTAESLTTQARTLTAIVSSSHKAIELTLDFARTTCSALAIQSLLTTTATSLPCRVVSGPIRTWPLDHRPSPHDLRTRTLRFTSDRPPTHENSQLVLQIPVIRHPISPPWQPKPDLRICWRKAVMKTQLTPQELKQIAFFQAIPLPEIKRIEFKLDPIHLTYWLKDHPSKTGQVASLTLFRNEKDNSSFLTSSSDE